MLHVIYSRVRFSMTHNVSYVLVDGSTVGSVGVSGAAADEDEYLAWAGVQALKKDGGLSTIPENHRCTTLKEE